MIQTVIPPRLIYSPKSCCILPPPPCKMLDDSTINIARADGASITTIRFADGTTRQFNYSAGAWT
ncbi:MAG: hypothetical protein IJU71_00420 [Selenomonadaceae bacterium]|nr:hypothetical protein [Selenomonadaceae bacterium]